MGSDKQGGTHGHSFFAQKLVDSASHVQGHCQGLRINHWTATNHFFFACFEILIKLLGKKLFGPVAQKF